MGVLNETKSSRSKEVDKETLTTLLGRVVQQSSDSVATPEQHHESFFSRVQGIASSFWTTNSEHSSQEGGRGDPCRKHAVGATIGDDGSNNNEEGEEDKNEMPPLQDPGLLDVTAVSRCHAWGDADVHNVASPRESGNTLNTFEYSYAPTLLDNAGCGTGILTSLDMRTGVVSEGASPSPDDDSSTTQLVASAITAHLPKTSSKEKLRPMAPTKLDCESLVLHPSDSALSFGTFDSGVQGLSVATRSVLDHEDDEVPVDASTRTERRDIAFELDPILTVGSDCFLPFSPDDVYVLDNLETSHRDGGHKNTSASMGNENSRCRCLSREQTVPDCVDENVLQFTAQLNDTYTNKNERFGEIMGRVNSHGTFEETMASPSDATSSFQALKSDAEGATDPVKVPQHKSPNIIRKLVRKLSSVSLPSLNTPKFHDLEHDPASLEERARKLKISRVRHLLTAFHVTTPEEHVDKVDELLQLAKGKKGWEGLTAVGFGFRMVHDAAYCECHLSCEDAHLKPFLDMYSNDDSSFCSLSSDSASYQGLGTGEGSQEFARIKSERLGQHCGKGSASAASASLTLPTIQSDVEFTGTPVTEQSNSGLPVEDTTKENFTTMERELQATLDDMVAGTEHDIDSGSTSPVSDITSVDENGSKVCSGSSDIKYAQHAGHCLTNLVYLPTNTAITDKNRNDYIADGTMYEEMARLTQEAAHECMAVAGDLEVRAFLYLCQP
jgi:hypothetical protein